MKIAREGKISEESMKKRNKLEISSSSVNSKGGTVVKVKKRTKNKNV
jgi:hypothetical protein